MRLPYKIRQKEYKRSFIPHVSGLRFYLDTFFENILFALTPLPKRGLNTLPRKETVVLSLSSFPARIDQAYVAIKSLMRQSVKADRIVLWLAEDQFKDFALPGKFNRLIKRGLCVSYVEDLRSHKKYYYALREQKPDELVITFDDDIIYEKDAVKKLIKKHNEYPECIVCNRGHEIEFDDNGLKPYNAGCPTSLCRVTNGAGLHCCVNRCTIIVSIQNNGRKRWNGSYCPFKFRSPTGRGRLVRKRPSTKPPTSNL